MSEKWINNLVNIKNTDYIYDFIWRRVKNFINNNDKSLLDSSGVLEDFVKIVGTDSYFIHYSLYPLLRERNPDERLEKVRKYLHDYMGSERFLGIRSLTTLNDELSLAYTIKLVEALTDKLYSEFVNRLKQISNRASQGDEKAKEFMKQPFQVKQNKIYKEILDNIDVQSLISESAEKAEKFTKTVKQVKDLLGGRKAGKEPGEFKKTLQLADKIYEVDICKEIITTANKIAETIPLAVRISKRRDTFGEELSGYTLTKRIERALPRELALPDELFLKKLTVDGFLTKEKLSIAEGAYYVLIDKSGSMTEGNKTVWSRSVALALFNLAQRKKRKFFMRFFDTRVYPEKPLTDKFEIMDAILTVVNDGGTEIDNAIKTAISDIVNNKLSEFTNTIILITDGEDSVINWTETFKKHNISLVSIMIEGDNRALRDISTQYLKAELTEEGGKEVLKIAEFY